MIFFSMRSCTGACWGNNRGKILYADLSLNWNISFNVLVIIILSWVVFLRMISFQFQIGLNLNENLIDSRIVCRNRQLTKHWSLLLLISLYIIQIASKAEFELLKTELTVAIVVHVLYPFVHLSWVGQNRIDFFFFKQNIQS